MQTAGSRTGHCVCCVLQPVLSLLLERLYLVSTRDTAMAAAAAVKCCDSVLGVQQLSQNGRDSHCSMNSKPSDLIRLSWAALSCSMAATLELTHHFQRGRDWSFQALRILLLCY